MWHLEVLRREDWDSPPCRFSGHKHQRGPRITSAESGGSRELPRASGQVGVFSAGAAGRCTQGGRDCCPQRSKRRSEAPPPQCWQMETDLLTVLKICHFYLLSYIRCCEHQDETSQCRQPMMAVLKSRILFFHFDAERNNNFNLNMVTRQSKQALTVKAFLLLWYFTVSLKGHIVCLVSHSADAGRTPAAPLSSLI